ncbi:MAG: hypothetical protein WA908_11800 [Pontixanthobacter sp.]
MRIAFLACPETMPGSDGARRGDAYEHDLMVAALRPAIEARGGTFAEIEWRAPVADFAAFDLTLLGTAWDYQDHAAEFLAKLEAIEAGGTIVCNPPDLVRWNTDKRYLRELENAGTRTIPTVWHDNPDRVDIESAFANFGCEKLVVKRQIGAGGVGQHIFDASDLPDADWRMGHAAMLQPFLPAIQQEGELSFVFIDGAFSHAIRKTAAKGEYRIQSLYGGSEETYEPSTSDIAAARSVLSAMPGDIPLYARVDMLRADDGGLLLMEAEAIEPYLYPEQGPKLGEKVATAIERRLSLSCA